MNTTRASQVAHPAGTTADPHGRLRQFLGLQSWEAGHQGTMALVCTLPCSFLRRRPANCVLHCASIYQLGALFAKCSAHTADFPVAFGVCTLLSAAISTSAAGPTPWRTRCWNRRGVRLLRPMLLPAARMGPSSTVSCHGMHVSHIRVLKRLMRHACMQRCMRILSVWSASSSRTMRRRPGRTRRS